MILYYASTINRPVLTKHEIAKGLTPVTIQAVSVLNKDAYKIGYFILFGVQSITKPLIAYLTAPAAEVEP